MKKILYLTDLHYEAKGRKYYEEDIYITGKMMDYFDVVLCHPKNSESFENDVDLIIFRNTGGVSSFKKIYNDFVERVNLNQLNVFNNFTGKADMKGKQYLIDLTELGYPVIPTVDKLSALSLLPESTTYVIKPKDGADSIGLEFVEKTDFNKKVFSDGEFLIQPAIDFEYEVSFYFINDKFEYALYAPDKSKRWELKQYDASETDVEFAKKFINWNDIKNGIQRVDACRTKNGELLLVELEDLNPYLSILELSDVLRDNFIKDFIKAIEEII